MVVMFKVGDRVRRKPQYQQGIWRECCEDHNCDPAAAYHILKLYQVAGNIWEVTVDMVESGCTWDLDKFELFAPAKPFNSYKEWL